MINLIICGHGHFASGIYSAVEQIIGSQQAVATVDFTEEMTTQQLEQALSAALSSLPARQGVVFFTDLLGGSPFRCAVQLSNSIDHADVIAGSNLQMLTEILMARDEINDITQFVNMALNYGCRGIISFRQQQGNTVTPLPVDGEGI